MRFQVIRSNIIENGWFIKDTVGKLTFPTSTNLNDLFAYCRALNKLYQEKGGLNMNEETKKLKELLTECREVFSWLHRYKAFNAYYGGMGYYEVLDCDVLDLNFKDLIEKIDEVMDNVES